MVMVLMMFSAYSKSCQKLAISNDMHGASVRPTRHCDVRRHSPRSLAQGASFFAAVFCLRPIGASAKIRKEQQTQQATSRTFRWEKFGDDAKISSWLDFCV